MTDTIIEIADLEKNPEDSSFKLKPNDSADSTAPTVSAASPEEMKEILQQWRKKLSDIEIAGYHDEHYATDKLATMYFVFFNKKRNLVKKRYTHFLELHDSVKDKKDAIKTYKLPKKKSLISTNTKATKEERKDGFNELLQLLVSDKDDIPIELVQFLDLTNQYDDSTDSEGESTSSRDNSISLVPSAEEDVEPKEVELSVTLTKVTQQEEEPRSVKPTFPKLRKDQMHPMLRGALDAKTAGADAGASGAESSDSRMITPQANHTLKDEPLDLAEEIKLCLKNKEIAFNDSAATASEKTAEVKPLEAPTVDNHGCGNCIIA